MENYLSECCYAQPVLEMDMSTVKYGGPSGFCGRCYDNCIFFIPCTEHETIDCEDCKEIVLGHEY